MLNPYIYNIYIYIYIYNICIYLQRVSNIHNIHKFRYLDIKVAMSDCICLIFPVPPSWEGRVLIFATEGQIKPHDNFFNFNNVFLAIRGTYIPF